MNTDNESYRIGYEAGYVSGLADGKKHMNKESINRQKDTVKRNALDGKRVCGKLYGYSVSRDGCAQYLRINEQESRVLIEIFIKYSQGYSTAQIAKDLNVRGIPSPRGRGWSKNNIAAGPNAGILSNPKYLGYFSYDTHKLTSSDRPWAGHFPNLAIVSMDLWCSVQKMRCARAVASVNIRRRLLSITSAGIPLPRRSVSWQKLFPRLAPWKWFRITTNQQEDKRSCREMKTVIGKIKKALSQSQNVSHSSGGKAESAIVSNSSGGSQCFSEISLREEFRTSRLTQSQMRDQRC